MRILRSFSSVYWVVACTVLVAACGNGSNAIFKASKANDTLDASAGGAPGASGKGGDTNGKGGDTNGKGGDTNGKGGDTSGSGGDTNGDAGDAASAGGSAGTAGTASGGSTTAAGGLNGAGGETDGGAPRTPTVCRTNSDCTVVPGRPLCDAKKGECIACHTNAQCATTQECVQNACKPLSTCKSSLDCASRTDGKTICDKTNGVCVQCTAASDCGSGKVCANRVCRTSCSSDNDCSMLHMLCNKGLSLGGQCTECTSTECANGKYCEAGTCVPLVCNPAQQSCSQNAVVQCNQAGSGVVPLKQCTLMPLAPACMASGDNADCVGTCYDGRRDALETDVDCGGAVCTRCSKGRTCAANADCASNKCTSEKCD